jgi:glutaredoxin
MQQQQNLPIWLNKVLELMPVTVFGANWCRYCIDAKKILLQTNTPYQFVDVSQLPEDRMKELNALTGGASIPKVFFGSQFLGGYAELKSSVL